MKDMTRKNRCVLRKVLCCLVMVYSKIYVTVFAELLCLNTWKYVQDNKPKLDPSLVEYTSHMRGAIPVLPVPLAWLCLILNIFIPGFGTIVSGLICLCIGKPRFSPRDGAKERVGAFLIDVVVGISQLFTVLFCLVGWGWSIWWGVIMLKMTKDASKWEVIAEDKQWMRSRKRGPVCLRCRERGHYRYQCVQQPALHRCSTCGAIGHQHHRCPNLICTTCGTRGDYHTTSCKKCLNYGKIKCSLCRMPGHEHKNCPDLWRRYHLTFKDDSELEMGPNNLKPVAQRWCSGCAKKGHFQHECKSFSLEHFPTLPNIINYGKSYNAALNIPKQTEPDTNIPVLGNTKLSQIRKYKNDVEKNNNKKFSFILQAMRRQCKKFANLQFLPVIEELDKDLKNNRFDGKKISTMYKLRNILKGRMS